MAVAFQKYFAEQLKDYIKQAEDHPFLTKVSDETYKKLEDSLRGLFANIFTYGMEERLALDFDEVK